MSPAPLLLAASAAISLLCASDGGAGGTKSAGSPFPAGMWWGEHVRLEATDRGVHVEFDCAHGSTEAPLQLDQHGAFSAAGVYVRERSGPIRPGFDPTPRPAAYSGAVRDRTMTLCVRLTDADEDIGTFSLELGAAGTLRKCR